ncbi:MAG: primase C-terminal domain-containing protein [Solibacillus sp.]
MNLVELFDTLLPKGLLTYKKIGSKASLPKQLAAQKLDQQSRQGVVFAVREKAHFANGQVKGYILTSKESLLEDAGALSHFTPNVYRYGTYSDEARNFIKGFSEDNLQQINTFVVDIDTKRYAVNELLLACLDESVGLPTWIIESDRGYQLYFVLSSPLFISNKENFRGLKVAKRISDNLKRSLKSVEADLYCNDFGFFRVPTKNNVVYVDLENTYTMHELIQWSMRRDDDQERPLFVVPTKKENLDLTRTDWFIALAHTTNIKGETGVIGRNNTLFTLALIGFAEGWDVERTENFLDEFNSRLDNPIGAADLKMTLHSAYSGKYSGPSKEYVETLLALHVKNGQEFTVSFGNRAWYKFKKEREDRTRSHYDEWEQDIIDYITAQKSSTEPFIWRTQRELCKAVGMAQSSLNELLKRSKELVKTVTGKGRGAKTGWTTVALFMKYVMTQITKAKAGYRKLVLQLITETVAEIEPVAGYTELQAKLTKLLRIDRTDTLGKQLNSSG